MGRKWSVTRTGVYEVYRRIMRGNRGIVTGSVWQEPSIRKYRWMAASDRVVRLGVSKSLQGALVACSRVMYRLARDVDN
jgi:hypothetical protein